MISAALAALTEPPYWMRIASATSWLYSSARRADRPAHVLGVLRGGRQAGADGPDRLVGDHDRRCLVGRDVGEAAVELAEGDLLLDARLALLLDLTDAHDRHQPVLVGGLHLGVDQASSSPWYWRRSLCPMTA